MKASVVALPLCHVVAKLRGTWGSDGSSGAGDTDVCDADVCDADVCDADVWNLS